MLIEDDLYPYPKSTQYFTISILRISHTFEQTFSTISTYSVVAIGVYGLMYQTTRDDEVRVENTLDSPEDNLERPDHTRAKPAFMFKSPITVVLLITLFGAGLNVPGWNTEVCVKLPIRLELLAKE